MARRSGLFQLCLGSGRLQAYWPHSLGAEHRAGSGRPGFALAGHVALTALICVFVAHVEIYGCWLSLVCCHLAAGSKGPSRRNAEYWSVEERLNLTGVPGQLVAWCGDPNYRIALEADEVVFAVGAEALAANQIVITVIATTFVTAMALSSPTSGTKMPSSS